MILIKEAKHNKLSGLKSLFLSFNFNQDIINILKTCELYNFDKSTCEWELPISSLAYLLDNLTFIDDIKLELDCEESNQEVLHMNSTTKHKTKLFPHQVEAVEYGLSHDKWLLLDAPGLGKTLSLIALAEELKEQKSIEHCLVICGINTLKTNWEKEIEKHSVLDSVVIGKKVSKTGSVSYVTLKERANQLAEPISQFFVIINIECLRDDNIVNAIRFGKNKFDMMVFDECHKAKGWGAQQSKGLLSLEANYMVGATGTLIMNNPLDAYTALAWIGVERKRNVTNFKKTYCVFDYMIKGRIIGFKNLPLLKQELESCSLRRKKELLKLPPKNIINEYIEMEDSHKTFYNEVKNGVKEECDKIDLKSNNALALITRLRQATSCPNMLTSKNIKSSKIERCLDLVNEITSNGDKVVIFSNFKEPIYLLETLLKEYKPLVGTGDMKDEEVSKNVDKFQNSDENKVFLGTIQKMGTGITLTRASYMIMIDQPWTEALYQQACDRIYRIGSEKPVFIYNLICEGTIDEVVAKIIDKKQAISEFIVDDRQDENTINILKQYLLDL